MELSAWLETNNLGKYAEVFAENEIDFDVLPQLTEDDLEKLGLSLGARRRFTVAIQSLGASQVSQSLESASVPAQAERRQLTVMFCDMVGFTKLASQVDPEILQKIIRVYEDACAAAITRYDGYVFQRLGDGIVAFFGYPLAHEGEAERAIRAGLDIIEAFSDLDVPDAGRLQVRIGIATGLVVVSSAEKGAVGETMNLASRLQGIAQVNSVVVSERVQRLAGGAFDYKDLGEQTLKGIAQPTRAYAIVSVSEVASRFEAATGEQLTPLVGREEEIGILLRRWQLSQDREGQVVLLSGEPGIGKSRVLNALREKLEGEGAQAMRFQCSPYYVNSAFWPSIDNFERALKFGRNEAPESKLDKLESLIVGHYQCPLTDVRFIASMLAIPCNERYGEFAMTPQKFKDETLRTLVDLTEAAASKKPSVLLFEDLHWADPTTLEVLDLMIDRVKTIPLLIVLTHRPEFQNRWADRGHVTGLNLSNLTRAQSAAMVSRVAGGKALPDDLLEQILARTDGVPLFVEELTKAILESGQLAEKGDRYEYTGSGHGITIPATLRDSLMARLDRNAPAKEIAQIGAAIGREFSHELISAVVPLSTAQLDSALSQLTDSALAFRRGTPPDAVYTFKHALVQDAAYDSLLKSRRQELHGEIAEVLEQRFPEVMENEPEVLAHHYTERGLAEKAIPYWIQAGHRDFQTLALPEAISHLKHSLRLLEDLTPSAQHDTWEIETRIILGSAYLAAGGWGDTRIDTTTRPALALSKRLQKPDEWLAACSLITIHVVSGARFEECRQLATECLSEGRRLGLDHHTLVGHGYLQWINGSLGNFEIARQHTIAFENVYREERHKRIPVLDDMKAWVDGWNAHHLWMMGWPEQAMQAMQAGIDYARVVGNPLNLMFCLVHGGGVSVYLREGGELLERADEASQLARDNSLGFLEVMLVGIWRGSALMIEGRFREGYEMMRAATALAVDANNAIMIPFHRLMAAEALAGLGRIDEAIEMLDGELDTIAKTSERMYEAEILRLRGVLTMEQDSSKASHAEEFLTRGIDVSKMQKARGWELRASTSLARLWRKQGKCKEAHELLAPVYNWFTEGFDTRDLKEAKALLDELAA